MSKQAETERETVIDAAFKDAVRGFVRYVGSKDKALIKSLIRVGFSTWDFKGFYSFEDWQAAIEKEMTQEEVKS